MARGYVVRFCFVYFTLWCGATEVLGGLLLTPFGGLAALRPSWPMRWVTNGHAIRMRLSLVGLDTFPLLNSGFRWVRPSDRSPNELESQGR